MTETPKPERPPLEALRDIVNRGWPGERGRLIDYALHLEARIAELEADREAFARRALIEYEHPDNPPSVWTSEAYGEWGRRLDEAYARAIAAAKEDAQS